MARCERCHKQTGITTGSFFNTQMICTDCDTEESKHPDYAFAKKIESDECSRGNYNFRGVGYPGKDGRVDRSRWE